MAEVKKGERRGLGRGLSALMADVATDAPAPAAPRPGDQAVPIEKIVPNPDQPRRSFTEEALAELAESIRAKGVIQPLIVRPNPRQAGTWEIVAGERRWRAAQRAQLHELPVIVRDFDDTEVLEVAIIENIQRADLNPVEEAAGYRQLMDRFGHTQEKLSQALGKSRSHIANLLRLLTLPDDVLEMLRSGSLTAGHARALVTAEDPSDLAREIVRKGLSVREAEALAKRAKAGPAKPRTAHVPAKDADTRVLETDLAAALGMSVSIEHDEASGGGRLTVRYRSLDDLDELCGRLSAAGSGD
jgi:ParB family chromosome partitioning protein